MNGQVVVDASLVFKWLVKEELTEEATSLRRSWVERDVTLIAPYFILAEVTNILHRRVVKGEITLQTGTDLIDKLIDMDIQLVETHHLHRRALELASQLNHGAAYDSHYLALAETLGCDLWTADQRLQRTSSSLSPAVHWLGELIS